MGTIAFPAIERSVLKRKEILDQERALYTATGREEVQNGVLVKMKSVTGAQDELCIEILESNGYDLKSSIEAFYSQR